SVLCLPPPRPPPPVLHSPATTTTQGRPNSSMAQWHALPATMMLILVVLVSMVSGQAPGMLHQLLGGWMTGGHNWNGQGWYPGHVPHTFQGKLSIPPGQQFPGQLAPPANLQAQALLRDAAGGNPSSLGYFMLGGKPFMVMSPAAGLARSEGIDGYAGPDGWITPLEGNDISLSTVEETWPLVEEAPVMPKEESSSIDSNTNDLIEGTLTFGDPISIDQQDSP
ncbi:unnamed protein product, partial [Meganyctiphanes norvegica]